MKKVLISTAILALLFLAAGVVKADSTLQINGGAGDPNLVVGGSFNVIQNQGGAGTITDLIILFSVASGSSAPSGLTSSAGTVGSLSLAGNLANSASCIGGGKDVYSCVGLPHVNDSNSVTNFNTLGLAPHGLPTASSFDIYEVTITGADLSSKGSITVSGNLGVGTFIDAFGTVGGTNYGTPFTEAGLTTGPPTSTPEPASLLLLGLGLAGAPFLRRRKS